ncbi:tetratricopeptide repeat protein [Brucepastera parasyntrophica]|uniref:periplasmic flagellar collar protein FlcA n=1 Tax=Brucepastera parasyntrophica TaxID=2880008 RepID=UPI00210B0E16|nr:tetratricopeptide repeat protein [Brucepastera parasyntrophica]ULQ59343.1 tetratricopeptide repeat protein [Brucepastera parasyntrophica]
MPGRKELEHLRTELTTLGDERRITAERKEHFEEYPLPSDTDAVSSLNVDDLLASLDASEPPSVQDEPEADSEASEQDLPDDEKSGFPEDIDFHFDIDPFPDTDEESAVPSDTAIPEESSPEAGAKKEPAVANDSGFSDFDSIDLDAISDADAGPMLPEEDPASPDLSGIDSILDSLPLDGVPGDDVSSPAETPGETVQTPAANDDDFGVPFDFDDSGFSPEIAGDSPDEIPADEDAGPDTSDSFSVPDDLLSGFADDIESSREGGESDAIQVDSGTDSDFSFEIPDVPDASSGFSSEEFGDLPDDFFRTEEDTGVTPSGDAAPADEGLSFGDDFPNLEIEDDMPDFDFSSSPDQPASDDFLPTSDFASDSPPGMDASDLLSGFDTLGSVDDIDIPAAPSSGTEIPDLDDFGDFSVSDAPAGSPSGDFDGFDGFSLDDDFIRASIEEGQSKSDGGKKSGISDLTSSILGGRKSQKKEIPLKISEEDFDRFLEIQNSYPLNLRIAVEEFITGDLGTEIQKMELVHEILNGTPIRKIARKLENILERSIPIPKDFEKKSVEEYELEKSSFKYIFLNKILPISILFTIIAVLSGCVFYLSWKFIYNPIVAENYYKQGYAAIEDGRYTQAFTLFDKGVQRWDKKRWYFRYARAFRDKKQYISAELMYERLLNRFKNDKAAGLEYAEMLRTDLRNFEKAELVLKRRVLDNHVNDKDGLLLLGDVYLDWAEEVPEKYEDARRAYASLVELYGSRDVYLARMMRYFIRTDNLAEVLPLKDHFMGKRAKLGAEDLVELSGYLVEKRYMPKAGDSETLRTQITDLRTLLERALQQGRTIPEAHYNMALFWIYNYRNNLAASSLTTALQLFEDARGMSPKRMLTRINAYRLLGELRAQEKNYNVARDLYAQGITLYENARANRTVKQDPLVGRLYADFGDTDYFISNNLDNALQSYEKAIAELEDTPSIRYRIGYIQYQKMDYEKALTSFMRAYAREPGDKNLLYSLGNTLFKRGDLYAAQGYYERLMEMLEAERLRKGIVFPQVRPDHNEFVQMYRDTANNLGVTLHLQALRTGDSVKNARSFALLSDAIRASDALSRNPDTLVRAERVSPAYVNMEYMLKPTPQFVPEIDANIPKVMENEPVLQQREDE